MERRDDEAFATRAGVDEPGSDERPAELVGEAAAEADDERLGTLARERAPAGQGRWIERRPRLVDDLEAVERRLGEALSISSGLDQPQSSAASWFANTSRRRASWTVIPASTASRIQPSRSSDAMGPGLTLGIASDGSTTRWPTFPHTTMHNRRDRRERK